jgi:DNA-binding MarR family transcriptional regulator
MTSNDDLDAFFDSFDAFAQAVRRARGVRVSGDPDALTLSQYGLLEPLLERPGARVQELADRAGIAAPTATRILDTLERRGLVTRDRAEHDRRAVLVALTPAGRAALGSRHEWMLGRERTLFESLPRAERALAPELLARLATLVDELAAGPG